MSAGGEPIRRNVRRERPSRLEPEAPTPARESTSSNRRVATAAPDEAPPRGSLGRALDAVRERLSRFSSFDRGRARRIASVVGKLVVVGAMLAAAGASVRLVERYVRTSPAFAIRTLRVGGASRLSRDEIIRAAGVTVGANVFAMPPEDVRARLERHPWIGSATVRRRLPGSIEIDVRERHAVAILVVDRTYLVGEDATVFKSLEPGDPIDLPVVTLADPSRWLGDRDALSALLLDVVSLAHDYGRVGLAVEERLEEIHVEGDDGLTLYVGRDAIEVRLGHGPYETKLRRLRRLMDEMLRRGSTPAYVRLDHERRPDRVVVRLRETVVPLPPLEEALPAPEAVPSSTTPPRARTAHPRPRV